MTIRERRVFVGRVSERAIIGRWLDDAMSGYPHIVMVGGEPGIGKSALCRELAMEAGRREMRVFSGQCYEQGSLKLPYLPFVEAIEQYVREASPNHAWDETAVVGRIVPGLRRGGFEPAAGAADESPYQLFEAVAGFLRRMGGEQPSVLVLEDLHDADAGTLDLLAHLGRRVGLARLLVVATYRDNEIDPSHSLAATLAALQRTEIAERMHLRGLDVTDLRELYERMTGASPPRGFCESLRSQTEGNPLFATETIRHLDAEGLLSAGSEATLRAVPAGLRDVVGRRLLGLSPATKELLSVASVLGREFRLDALERMPGVHRVHLAEALDEARAARIVEERAGGAAGVAYRFTHALFRQYLYEGIPGARRRSVHLDAGNTLEALHGSNGDHADVIAEHLAHSSDPRDLEHASRLSEEAARRALSVHAFADAARITQRALDSFQQAGGEDRARRCELLLLLAAAQTEAGQPRAALDGPIQEAFAIAEAVGDAPRATLAASLARTALAFDEPWRALTSAEGKMWGLRFDRWAPPATFQRVMADVHLAAMAFADGSGGPRDDLFEAARDLAWRIDDPAACWFAGAQRVFYPRSPARADDRKATIDALLALSREGVPSATLAMGFYMASEALVEFGDRDRAEPLWEDLAALARRTGAPFTRDYANLVEYTSGVLDGRFRDALGALAETDEAVRIAGSRRLSGSPGRAYRAMLHQGIAPEPASLDAAPPWVRAAHNASAGDLTAARDFLDVARRAKGRTHPVAPWTAALRLEIALAAGDREMVSEFACQLEGTQEITNSLVMVNRVVGEARHFLGQPDEARALLLLALDQARAMRFRPEVALTRTELAALLLDHYPAEVDDARRHLEAAIPELQEMGMRPGLERAEALWARLDRVSAGDRGGRPGGLTSREVEVLRLIASGRTNREISAELVLSERTVGRHITNIYAKIDARGKADATAFALRHNLA
jgi:DNA-binding CsgD family transcriptional regulator